MFDILTSVVIKAVEKIFDMGADIGKYEVQKKRKLLSKFILLYESLEKLEQTSENAFSEFILYAGGESTPTKLIIKNRLESLEQAYKKYANTIGEIDTVLSIYDNDLSISLSGLRFSKGAILSNVSLLLETYPKMMKDDGKISFSIKFPTALPDINNIETNYHRLGKTELNRKAKSIHDGLLQEFKFRYVDMRNKDEVRFILKHSRDNIQYQAIKDKFCQLY